MNTGAYPAWSGSGRELFFKDLNDNIFVCTVIPKGTGGQKWARPSVCSTPLRPG